MNGYCRLGVARQHYPQVHWVISFLPFLCKSSVSVSALPSVSEVSFHPNWEAKVSVSSQKSLTHCKLTVDHKLVFFKGGFEGNSLRT